MNIVRSSVLRSNLSDILDELTKKRDYLLVSRKGKPVTAMVNLDFLEDLLAMSNHEYLDSIKKAREDYKKGRVYTIEETFGEL